MALFEKNYKAAAVTELERSVRDLEERDKTAETKPVFQKDMSEAQSNLNFAERLNLVSAVQADTYRERMKKAHQNFERLERNETRDIVNDLENPRERSARYQDMDMYHAQLAQERAKASVEKGDVGQNHTTVQKDTGGHLR